MSGIENDIHASEQKVNHLKKSNWPHMAIVGCMAVGLGSAVVTGLKESTGAHVVSSLCFVGTAMLHLFMHHRQLLHKVKTGFNNGR